ncbi:hypothetical protein AVEN_153420-1 [Araneus ventricosus]|uniref:Uncharacterized protein n=1 Tax=Araneus ventricosus TaxID=182803 RepID=A0A4Y2EB42_ARAVE|nr:hypothetical protein AVEN_153420-1 [Araneus ventricosus]
MATVQEKAMCKKSKDITPLDFFLWGFVKNIVYKTPVPSLDELKRRIVTAIQNVTPQMLENTWREIEFRFDVLRATKGSHVQIHYLRNIFYSKVMRYGNPDNN